MGQAKSKELLRATEEEQHTSLQNRDKRPEMVKVDRPRIGERRAVLTIPNSPYKVLYVDPHQRGDVVGKHGYVVLKTAKRGWTGGSVDGVMHDGEEFGDVAGPRRKSSQGSDASSVVIPGHDEDPFAALPKPEGAAPRDTNDPDSLDMRSDDGKGDTGAPKKKNTGGRRRSSGQSSSQPFAGYQDPQIGDRKTSPSGRKYTPSKQDGTAAGAQHHDPQSASGTLGANGTLKDGTQTVQQYYRPVGKLVSNFIFFEDRRYMEDEVGVLEPQEYEHEEDEIYDMAGVKRVAPKSHQLSAEDLTYEIPSKVLDAIRLAIDAPLRDVRPADGIDKSEDDMMKEFREQALKALEAEKQAAGETDNGPEELVVMSGPVVDHNMTYEEIEHKSKVKRKKALHKEVTQYKKEFEAQNKRKPTADEMHADPDFGPTYREYLKLRKELADPHDAPMEEDEQRKPPTGLSAGNDASPQQQRGGGHTPQPEALTVQARPTLLPTAAAGGEVGLRARENWPQIRSAAVQLQRWKDDFALRHGAAPTKADTMLNPDASDMLMLLRKLAHTDAVPLTPQDFIDHDRETMGVAGYVPSGATPQANTGLEPAVDHAKRLEEIDAELKKLQSDERVDRRSLEVDDANERKMLAQRLQSVVAAQKAVPWAKNAVAPTGGDLGSTSEIEAASGVGNGPFKSAPPAHAARDGAGASELPTMAGDEDDTAAGNGVKRAEILQWLYAWRDSTISRLGRPLSLQDLEDDPMAFARYEELKQYPPTDDCPGEFTLEPPTMTAEMQERQANRRKQLGKQLNKWKENFAAENGRKPTAADIAADPLISQLYAEYASIPKQEAHLPEARSVTPQAAGDGPDVAASPGSMLSDASAKKRRKQVQRELDDWKAAFAEQNGRDATEDDVHADADANALWTEYLQLRERRRSSRRPSMAVNMEATLPLEELKEKRKRLAKELNAWKGQFEADYGRKPTANDIAENPEIAQLYESYRKAKEEEEAMAATLGAEGGQQEVIPPSGVSPDPNSNYHAVHKRRKQLAKELNAWKAAFAETNGRKPKEADIQADEEIRAVFEEHEQLKAQESQMEASGMAEGSHSRNRRRSTYTPQPSKTPEPGADGEDGAGTGPFATASPGAQPNQRKQLGAQLNRWKAEFTTANGRAPTVSDIVNDPDIAEVYQQYIALPKAGKGAADGDASPQAGAAPQQASAPPAETDDTKARRKALAKQLNAWKVLFTETNGRPPKTQDILDDPEISPVYEDYLTLKKDDE